MKNVLVSIVVALLVVGCNSGAPECGDGDVKKLVMDIVKPAGYKKLGIYGNKIVIYGLSVPIDGDREGDIAAYNKWQSAYGGSKDGLNMALNMISAARNGYKNINNAELITIRVESNDDALRKSTCKAQVDLNSGSNINISYSAQITSEGDLYVEVFGL